MASTEQLIFDIVTRDRASAGLSKVGSAASSAAGNVDGLTKRLDEVGRKTATARLALAGDKEAQASLDKIDAKIVSLDRRTASPNITVEGAARATAEISALDLELDKLGKKGGSADVATAAVGSGGMAGPGGMMALVGAGIAVAPVLATTAIGLAGLAGAAYATVSPILAAGTATAAQQKALEGLDPAQRAAYTSLGALKAEFGGFAKSLEPEVIGVFNKGLQLAGGLLRDVQPVAAATGKGLAAVVGAIDADLKTQQWQNFFGFMAKTAGPDIQLIGGLFVNLLNVLPPLLTDLQPLAVEMIQVADGAARITTQIAGLPADIDSLRQATDKFTGSIGQHLPAGNENIFQVVSGWVDWMGKHVPGGNKSLLDLAGSAGKASSATAAAGIAAAAAAPQVGTLAGDVALLNSNTVLATDATRAFNDMWLQFVGKSVSDQQAVLNTAAAFDAYNTSLTVNKADSTAAQQAFLAIITTMGSGLSTLQQNGATVGQLNSYYQTNIDKLNSLHGLTPQQRADIQGITRDYDTWANSTAGLTRQTEIAASALKTQFLAQIGSVAASAPGVSGDVSNLADAILKTGTTSSATRADRAALIADLEKAGMSADAARALVKNLEAQIAVLTGKTVAINVVTNAPPGSAARSFLGFASGGMIPGSGNSDSVPAMLTPGEVVVPKRMVAAGALDHLRGRLPGFAAGGLVAGAPEPVIPAGRAGSGGDVHYHVTVNVPPTVNPREAGRQIGELILAHTRTGGNLYPPGTVPR